MERTETLAPVAAIENDYTLDIPKDKRSGLGEAIWFSIEQSIADSQGYRQVCLDSFNNYEQLVPEIDDPWPDCANVFVALTPSMVNTVVAQIAGMVLTPGLVQVKGLDPEAAQTAAQKQVYLNGELLRPRVSMYPTWMESLYHWLNFSALYGWGVMETPWRKTQKKVNVIEYEPEKVDFEGTQLEVATPDQKIKMKPVKKTIMKTVFDDVDLSPLEPQDVVVVPAISMSLDLAYGVGVRKKFSESDLLVMSREKKEEHDPEPVLWRDAVEEILATLGEGESDLAQSQIPTDTYEMGGQFSVSDNHSTSIPGLRTQKGPIVLWQYHTNAIFVDDDGDPAEIVLWIHEQTHKVAGAIRYPYFLEGRPFESLAIDPRSNRIQGFGIPYRLMPTQSELNTQHNQKLNAIDLRILAPMGKLKGVTISDKGKAWHPGAEWEMTSEKDVFIPQLPDIPQSVWLEENTLWQNAERLMGTNAPMMGGTNPGRRTAREISTAANAASVRLNLMATRFRYAIRNVLHKIVALKLQFGAETLTPWGDFEDPDKVAISKQILAQKHEVTVTGISDPIDKQSRVQEMMVAYSLVHDSPIVQSDPVMAFKLIKLMLDTMGRLDVEWIMGTVEDFQAKVQAMQQQQMALAQAGMGAPPGAGPPGSARPPGNGQPPQQQQRPQPAGFSPGMGR